MKIPGYTIEREIGHGGMATVYLAVQESLGRKVALKVMSVALAADRTFSDRFIREARTVAQLTHPNIVAIHDVGIAGHVHYLALEFISGGDLKDRVRQGPMPPYSVLPVVREVATALGYAHGKGFVHRDVSPENILFREDGRAILTDFGIARGPGSGTRMTGTGMAIGKPHYMSPEQARGKDTDGRADIYALGIVLYEMLTGKVPYDAEETLAIGIMHVTEPVPELPASLAGYQPLLDRMLAKKPDDRFRTAEELVDAIDNHDPSVKPRKSGPRNTVVMPTLLSQDEPASAPALSLGGKPKWALLGGVAAIALLGAAYLFVSPGLSDQSPAGEGGVSVLPQSRGPVVIEKEPEKIRQAEIENTNKENARRLSLVEQAKRDAAEDLTRRLAAEDAARRRQEAHERDQLAWGQAERTNTEESYRRYQNDYPRGRFVAEAVNRIRHLENEAELRKRESVSPPTKERTTKVVKVLVKEGYYEEVKDGGEWVTVYGNKVWKHHVKKVWIPPQYEEVRESEYR